MSGGYSHDNIKTRTRRDAATRRYRSRGRTGPTTAEEARVRKIGRHLVALISRRKGGCAVGLVIAAVLFAGLYRVANGVEKHSYNAGAVPPMTVSLTAGHIYEISVPGGRKALQDRGVSASQAQCSWSQGAQTEQVLTVTVLSADVRPTHAIATFVAPVSGEVHIDCAGWGAVYVDDADNSGWDYAGLFLVLTAVFLTLGVALGLSAAYARSPWSPRDRDEVETAAEPLAGNHEVGGTDAGHVTG